MANMTWLLKAEIVIYVGLAVTCACRFNVVCSIAARHKRRWSHRCDIIADSAPHRRDREPPVRSDADTRVVPRKRAGASQ